jgi:hypothetical protein
MACVTTHAARLLACATRLLARATRLLARATRLLARATGLASLLRGCVFVQVSQRFHRGLCLSLSLSLSLSQNVLCLLVRVFVIVCTFDCGTLLVCRSGFVEARVVWRHVWCGGTLETHRYTCGKTWRNTSLLRDKWRLMRILEKSNCALKVGNPQWVHSAWEPECDQRKRHTQ